MTLGNVELNRLRVMGFRVIFKEDVKPLFNPVSWLSGGCLRELLLFVFSIYPFHNRISHEAHTSHDAFMLYSLGEMLNPHVDHCSSITYFLNDRANSQLVSKTIIFYLCVNMHQLPWGVYEAHIIPGMICANNELLLGLLYQLHKKHRAGQEMGFILNPNVKIIKFDVPTFRVLNEKEEKNPCRTFFLSYSPSFGDQFVSLE